MKERLTRVLAALAMLLAAAALALPASAAGPVLGATEAYCIMDAESGLVLAQQNMDEELHPRLHHQGDDSGPGLRKGPGGTGPGW